MEQPLSAATSSAAPASSAELSSSSAAAGGPPQAAPASSRRQKKQKVEKPAPLRSRKRTKSTGDGSDVPPPQLEQNAQTVQASPKKTPVTVIEASPVPMSSVAPSVSTAATQRSATPAVLPPQWIRRADGSLINATLSAATLLMSRAVPSTPSQLAPSSASSSAMPTLAAEGAAWGAQAVLPPSTLAPLVAPTGPGGEMNEAAASKPLPSADLVQPRLMGERFVKPDVSAQQLGLPVVRPTTTDDEDIKTDDEDITMSDGSASLGLPDSPALVQEEDTFIKVPRSSWNEALALCVQLGAVSRAKDLERSVPVAMSSTSQDDPISCPPASHSSSRDSADELFTSSDVQAESRRRGREALALALATHPYPKIPILPKFTKETYTSLSSSQLMDVPMDHENSPLFLTLPWVVPPTGWINIYRPTNYPGHFKKSEVIKKATTGGMNSFEMSVYYYVGSF